MLYSVLCIICNCQRKQGLVSSEVWHVVLYHDNISLLTTQWHYISVPGLYTPCMVRTIMVTLSSGPDTNMSTICCLRIFLASLSVKCLVVTTPQVSHTLWQHSWHHQNTITHWERTALVITRCLATTKDHPRLLSSCDLFLSRLQLKCQLEDLFWPDENKKYQNIVRQIVCSVCLIKNRCEM